MKFFTSYFFLLPLVILALFSFSLQSAESDFDEMVYKELKKTIPLISTEELVTWKSKKLNFHLFDTRELDEYNVSHIAAAKWIGYSHFSPFVLKDFNKSDTVVVYCSIGVRSEKIAEKIRKYGYKNVFNLFGGIFRWVNSNQPVVDHKNNPTQKIHPYNENWGKWLSKGIKAYE